MTPQDFLYYQIGVAIFLVVILLTVKRKLPPPSQLDLSREKNPNEKLLTQDPAKVSGLNNEKKADLTKSTHQWVRPSTSNPARRAPKSLNVMFNYNGHSWDAYEVLGVPAGSTFEEAQAAYLKMVASSKPDSVDFLTTALECIRKNL